VDGQDRGPHGQVFVRGVEGPTASGPRAGSGCRGRASGSGGANRRATASERQKHS